MGAAPMQDASVAGDAPAPAPAQGQGALGGRLSIVLDTNVLLDLFIFRDPRTDELRAALEAGALRWWATAAMREELRRVLGYPQLEPRMAFHGMAAEQVLAAFDRHATLCDAAPKAPYACKDADDQKFIDLAVAQAAALISKDKAVLCMARRLARLGVPVAAVFQSTSRQALHECMV